MILRLRHIHAQPEQLSQGLGGSTGSFIRERPGSPRTGLPSPSAQLQPHWVAPILYFDRTGILPRIEARRRLLLPMDRRVVYLQLGSGNIDDAGTWTTHALDLLARRPDVEVVLAQSPIADQAMTRPPGVHLIRQYPNARFFNALDLAISAAGYNTVHELLLFRVPAILIPMRRLTDDQEGRARAVERAGAAVVVNQPEDLAPALEHLLGDDARARLRNAARRLIPENGADEAACDLRSRTGVRWHAWNIRRATLAACLLIRIAKSCSISPRAASIIVISMLRQPTRPVGIRSLATAATPPPKEPRRVPPARILQRRRDG